MVLRALGRNALFNAAALPLRVFPPLFNRYDSGMKFDAHVDNAVRFVPGANIRVRTDISATLFLSEPSDYDGGELVIEDTYGTQSVKLPAGHMVLDYAERILELSDELDKRVGDFARSAGPSGAGGAMAAGMVSLLRRLSKQNGLDRDPVFRQDLVKLHTLHEVGRMLALRVKAEKAACRDIPAAPNIAKLSMSEIMRQSRDLGLRCVGAAGTLHAYDAEGRRELEAATGEPALPFITELALFAQGPPIYGGTDQVQRNILGERVLGLPKEPNDDRVKSWAELPRNG